MSFLETSNYKNIVERPGIHHGLRWGAYSAPQTLTDGDGASCPLSKNPTPLSALQTSDGETPLTALLFFDNSHTAEYTNVYSALESLARMRYINLFYLNVSGKGRKPLTCP